jgi:hypothetical protein|tara:strand:+ start:328 stop:516 length:189 start_codon:yes stop_codon:yes gene_type:complete
VTAEIRYKDKWKWYAVLYNLADGNVLNIDKVTKIQIYEALTFLAYKQDLNVLEKERRNGTGF